MKLEGLLELTQCPFRALNLTTWDDSQTTEKQKDTINCVVLSTEPKSLSGATDKNIECVFVKQVKPGFTTYQTQVKYFCALSKIEEKATKNNKTNII